MSTRRRQRVAVVGGGWAGLAAAVHATTLGHEVVLLEAARHWGGRARRLDGPETSAPLDNGQHILIGAYTATLDLMQRVGVDVQRVLLALPLTLRFADGTGLATPPAAARWPAAWGVLAAILTARGWTTGDKWALLKTTLLWRLRGFRCPSGWTVDRLCQDLPERVRAEMLEPLCLSALNTPMAQASATVFLRVLQDAMLGAAWGPYRSSDLLVPRRDLGQLLPDPAVAWLTQQSARCEAGQRVQALSPNGRGWNLATAHQTWTVDHVVLACPPGEAARLLQNHEPALAWVAAIGGWAHEAIATVYLQAPPGWAWPSTQALLALRGAPAQFVFHRAVAGGPQGLLAFVASAWRGEREALEAGVAQQAQAQLGLLNGKVVQTVIEKRATFACTPGLHKPSSAIAPGLWAAGDWVDGPYPATLEAAVRSGWSAAQFIDRACQG